MGITEDAVGYVCPSKIPFLSAQNPHIVSWLGAKSWHFISDRQRLKPLSVNTLSSNQQTPIKLNQSLLNKQKRR